MLKRETLQAAHQRFAEHYLNNLKSLETDYTQGRIGQALAGFDENSEQILRAWHWTADHAPHLCAGFNTAGATLWRIREVPRNRLDWYQSTLTLVPDESRAFHLLQIGLAQLDLGEQTPAEETLRQALGQVDEQTVLRGRILTHLAQAIVDSGRLDEAENYLREALAIFADDSAGRAQVLQGLGNLYGKRAQFADAEACLQESLALYRTLNDRLRMTSVLGKLADFEMYRGGFDEAMAHYTASLEVYRQFNYLNGISTTLRNIGYIHYQHEEFSAAEAQFEEALVVMRRLGNPMKIANLYSYWGDLEFERENFDRALHYYQAALTEVEQAQHHFGMIAVNGQVACAFSKLQQPARAAEHFIKSLQLCLEVDAPPYLLDIFAWIAGYFLIDYGYADTARMIAAFLYDYPLSLEYLRESAGELLQALPPAPIPDLPTTHQTMAMQLIEFLYTISF